MKKLIVLFSSVIIAASAAAQTERSSTTSQATGTGSVDRQAPVNNNAGHKNAAEEPPESANIVDPDFQGSSKQGTTASGMGQPKQDNDRSDSAKRTGSAAQDAEDKTKK